MKETILSVGPMTLKYSAYFAILEKVMAHLVMIAIPIYLLTPSRAIESHSTQTTFLQWNLIMNMNICL